MLAFVSCGSAPPPETGKAEPAPVNILQFYASPVTIAKGDRALLCYGVEGAASVRLQPAVEELAPSRARCVEVKPEASTKYVLFATNAAGAEVSKEIEVVIDPKMKKAVAPAAAREGLILFFTASQQKVSKGTAVMLCYEVKGASAVSVSPSPGEGLTPPGRMCFQARPEATTNYVLTATSAAGGKDTESVRITVE
jgi:hypothetical protein